MTLVGWLRVMGGGTRGASVNTAVSCPVTSAGAAGTPPGFVVCAVAEASTITSPRNKTSPRRKRCATPRLYQDSVLCFMLSSFLVVCKAQLWLYAGSKENATRAKARRVLCINHVHRACMTEKGRRMTPCLLPVTECQK